VSIFSHVSQSHPYSISARNTSSIAPVVTENVDIINVTTEETIRACYHKPTPGTITVIIDSWGSHLDAKMSGPILFDVTCCEAP